MFVAFVSFVLTDRSARRFFLLLFVLSFVRLVYRLFFCVSSVFVSSRSLYLCPVFRVLIRLSSCPSIRPLVVLSLVGFGFSYEFYVNWSV